MNFFRSKIIHPPHPLLGISPKVHSLCWAQASLRLEKKTRKTKKTKKVKEVKMKMMMKIKIKMTSAESCRVIESIW